MVQAEEEMKARHLHVSVLHLREDHSEIYDPSENFNPIPVVLIVSPENMQGAFGEFMRFLADEPQEKSEFIQVEFDQTSMLYQASLLRTCS